jgi:N utilization substance protein A
VILDLGDAEAILPGSERIPFERLERGNRVTALILGVRNEAKGAQIVVSRSHPDLVRRLLELEVPELTDGTVEIVNIAREPGHRTKIAVISHDPNVDPKGACVGARGSRVRQVVNELRGEKVDVVQWRDDIGQFIAEALGPAKVKEVHIDEETKTSSCPSISSPWPSARRARTPVSPLGSPATKSTSDPIWKAWRWR